MLKYKFTDLGKIFDKPTSQGSNRGAYAQSIIATKDLSDFTADYDWIVYHSTDHDTGDGGTWVEFGKGEIGQIVWTDYDVALANGSLDSMSNLPAGNPIYINTVAAGKQTETPQAKIINDTVYLMTHNNQGKNYPGVGSNQNTAMSTSTDGLNFTHRNYVLTYNFDTEAGNGHTGYPKWTDNPFPMYDFDYIAYSIAGGSDSSNFAIWGCNFEDILQPWTLIKVFKRDAGRVWDGSEFYTDAQLSHLIDPDSLIPQDDGTFMAIAGSNPQGSSGAGLSVATSNQVLLAADGITFLSKPERLMPFTSENINGISLTGKLSHEGVDYMLYRGIGAGDSSTADAFIGIASYVIEDGSVELLDPPDSEHEDVTFIGKTELPESVSLMTGNGSLAFTANGLEITIPEGMSEGLYLQDVKTNMKMLDISWVRLRQKTPLDWYPRVGFVKDYVRGSAFNHPNYVSTGYEDTSDDNWHKQMTVSQVVNGTETALDSYPYNVIGRLASNYENSIVPTTYGIRWMPTEDRLALLNTEHEQNFVDASTLPEGEYTPFIQIDNIGNTEAITVIIEGVSFGQAGDIDFAWTLDSKPSTSTATLPSATAKNFDFAPDVNGAYTFGLVASDEDDSSTKVFKSISIGSVNTKPSKPTTSGPTTAQVNTDYDIVAAATDDGGASNLVYEVTVTPASISYIQDGDTVTVSTGTYTGNIALTFRAFDGVLYSDPTTHTIAVSNNAQESIGRITILDVTDGLQPIKIFSEVTDTKIYEGSPRFTNGVAFVTLPVAVGVSWFGRWLGTNPPQTGTGIFGVSE
jgi:hypothetical protein